MILYIKRCSCFLIILSCWLFRYSNTLNALLTCVWCTKDDWQLSCSALIININNWRKKVASMSNYVYDESICVAMVTFSILLCILNNWTDHTSKKQICHNSRISIVTFSNISWQLTIIIVKTWLFWIQKHRSLFAVYPIFLILNLAKVKWLNLLSTYKIFLSQMSWLHCIKQLCVSSSSFEQ